MYSAEANAFEFRNRFRQEAGADTNTDALLGRLEATLHQVPPSDLNPQQKVAWSADHLHELGNDLMAAGLPSGFNLTYGSLTSTIAENFSDYRSPDTLGNAVVRFKGYYTAPLLGMTRFLKGEDAALDTMLRTWIQATLHPKLLDPDIPDAIQTSMGIGGHIIADLIPTLVLSDPPESYRDDYMTVVAEHIAETIRQLAPQLIPGHRSLRALSIPAMNKMIHVGRLNAWHDYEKARQLNPESQQRLYARRDRQAEQVGRFYLKVGGSALALARATERLNI